MTAASEHGYVFHEKKGEINSLIVNGEIRQFLLLSKVDFSSDRKRMSVVMRDMDNNKLYLFCKGADSMILKRVSANCCFDLIEKTEEDLKAFSKEGLRTLAIAYKELDEEEFANWQVRYSEAQQEEYNALCEVDPREQLSKVRIHIIIMLLIYIARRRVRKGFDSPWSNSFGRSPSGRCS